MSIRPHPALSAALRHGKVAEFLLPEQAMIQLWSSVPEFNLARARMVEYQLVHRIRDPRVLHAMRDLERHLFVPDRLVREAYEDTPLAIGYGQTISQPLIIALMLEAAELKGCERVLDVGTGSGYQAALLARLARDVYSLELIPEVAELARGNLARAGAGSVQVATVDGSTGWPQAAPFDAILVTAACREPPGALVQQLAVGGRLILPLGSTHQVLTELKRTPTGVVSRELAVCTFAPLRLSGERVPSNSTDQSEALLRV